MLYMCVFVCVCIHPYIMPEGEEKGRNRQWRRKNFFEEIMAKIS